MYGGCGEQCLTLVGSFWLVRTASNLGEDSIEEELGARMVQRSSLRLHSDISKAHDQEYCSQVYHGR